MSILQAPSHDSATASLESRIAHLRDELFAVAQEARERVPYDSTALHVSLQTASNELGNAERALRDGAAY